jgi:hypothetical protein
MGLFAMSSTLPEEIWSIVVSFLPWLPHQKRWQPWVFYRTVNRTFKHTIERYYIEEWLEWSSIAVDCDDSLVIGQYHFALSKEYIFVGFVGPDDRLAMYRDNQEDGQPRRDRCTVCLFTLFLLYTA